MLIFKRKIFFALYTLLMNNQFHFVNKLRSFLFRNILSNNKISGLNILSGVFVEGYDKLILGNNVSINQNCFLSAYGGLEIGDNVSIGHGVSILTSDHDYSDLLKPIKTQPIIFSKVVIGNDVFIGANVTILSGVSIPQGTVIGAGSVLTKSITECNCIYGGIPAKKIKKRI